MLTIYLAGSVHALTEDEARGWRDVVNEALTKLGHKVLDPLRNKGWAGSDTARDYTINEIVHRDLADVGKSDVLLVEMEHDDRNYVGTVTEMATARAEGKLVVVNVGERTTWSPWVDYLATTICRSWKECLAYICEVLDD